MDNIFGEQTGEDAKTAEGLSTFSGEALLTEKAVRSWISVGQIP